MDSVAKRVRKANPSGNERGAVIVEAALITPILIILVFGVIESSLLFKDYLTVSNASRTGARIGSAAGSAPDSDYEILRTVEGSSAALDNGIAKIVVFKASDPDGKIPTACLTGPQSGLCNVYVTSDLARPAADFGQCGTPSPGPDCSWAPGDRRDDLGDPPIDYIGVYFEAEHQAVTGLFGFSRPLSDETIMRVEPVRG